MTPTGASLVGGFAKAYRLQPTDFVDEPAEGLPERLSRAVRHMNEDHADAVDAIAAAHGLEGSGWRIATADRSGFELRFGDRIARLFFEVRLGGVEDIRSAFVALAAKAQSVSPIA